MEMQERVIDSQTFNVNYFVLVLVTSDIKRKFQLQMGRKNRIAMRVQLLVPYQLPPCSESKYLALLIVRGKVEKVPRDIQGEKSRKDTAISGKLVSSIGALASPKKGCTSRKEMSYFC